MSEYWVSHKKYYCTYCKIYISDDAPSRQQHENGLRHKGNKERFVRSLYKTSEKRKQDLEEEKREIARIDQAAQAAFAHDVGSGIAKSASSNRPVASTSAGVAKPVAPKPSSPWANYSTAESLGYSDPDAERIQAEAERRRTQGVAGEWEIVSASTSTASYSGPSTTLTESNKREAQAVDEEDTRHFKLRRKTAKGLGDTWDPELIPIKLKAKEEREEAVVSGEGTKIEEEMEQIAAPPKWTSRGWKRPGESNQPDVDNNQATSVPQPQSEQQTLSPDTQNIPLEDVDETLTAVKVEELKAEELIDKPASESGGSLFRKRKIGGTSRGKR